MQLERQTVQPTSPWRRSAIALVAIGALFVAACASTPGAGSGAATRYVVDPFWPKPLPEKWQVGAVAGVAVDRRDHVWIAGNHDLDHQVLKFTGDGKFLLQIGKAGQTGGSNDTRLLGKPAHMELDVAANELYVADGYGNRRVIVFDATSGAYKRHWGAYGNKPDDAKTTYDPAAPPSKQFGTPVHCVRLARDGLVYVCDRENDRIQVFRKSGEFVREFFVAKETRQIGSVWDMVLSADPEQTYMYVADGGNNVVHVLRRDSGAEVSAFGRNGRMAGQFHWVHNIAIDSKGNIYTAEVDTGKRLQRFTPAP